MKEFTPEQISALASLVDPDRFGLQLATVTEAHEDLTGISHDVFVGENIAVRVDDEAGADGALARVFRQRMLR